MSSPCSTRYRPSDRYAWPFWSAKPSRIRSPDSSRICPDPWICRKKSSTGSYPREHRNARDCSFVCAAALLEFRARPVRHEPPAIEAPAQVQTAHLGVQLGEIDDDQVLRNAVDRKAEGRSAGTAAGEYRFVVARHQALRRAIGRDDRIRRECGFKEATRRRFVGDASRALASVLERTGRSYFRAAGNKGLEAGQHRGRRPAGERRKLRRFIARLGRRGLHGRRARRAYRTRRARWRRHRCAAGSDQ